MLLIVMKSCHPTLIKIDSGTQPLTLNKLNYVGLIRKITICFALRIVQSLKSAEFEVIREDHRVLGFCLTFMMVL